MNKKWVNTKLCNMQVLYSAVYSHLLGELSLTLSGTGLELNVFISQQASVVCHAFYMFPCIKLAKFPSICSYFLPNTKISCKSSPNSWFFHPCLPVGTHCRTVWTTVHTFTYNECYMWRFIGYLASSVLGNQVADPERPVINDGKMRMRASNRIKLQALQSPAVLGTEFFSQDE